jgi:restriction system protein
MASRTPDRSRQRGLTVVRILGLVLVVLGSALLLLPELDQTVRPVGAGGVLAGVLVLGSHVLRQLKAQLMADGPLKEPDFHKPAHGASNFGSSTAPHLARLSAARPAPAADPAVSLLDPSVQLGSPAVPAALPAPVPAPPTAWGPEVFEAMSAQQFESVCEALFAQGGFGTRCQSHGAAGGVTIWLHSRHAQQGKDRPVAVAHCKQWRGHPVSVKEMHPLLELMEARQLKRGTYATSSSYTDNARKFAKYNSINALDRAGLLGLIAARTPAQQQALLAIAQAGA